MIGVDVNILVRYADDQDKSLGGRPAGTKNSLHLPSELVRVPVEIVEHIKGLVEEYKDQCKGWVDEGREVEEKKCDLTDK